MKTYMLPDELEEKVGAKGGCQNRNFISKSMELQFLDLFSVSATSPTS